MRSFDEATKNSTEFFRDYCPRAGLTTNDGQSSRLTDGCQSFEATVSGEGKLDRRSSCAGPDESSAVFIRRFEATFVAISSRDWQAGGFPIVSERQELLSHAPPDSALRSRHSRRLRFLIPLLVPRTGDRIVIPPGEAYRGRSQRGGQMNLPGGGHSGEESRSSLVILPVCLQAEQ